MREGKSDAGGDALGTTGLFLIVTAVIAFAVCMAGVSLARGGCAITAGTIALLSFGASVACFSAESRPLPEPDIGAVPRL